MGRAERRRLDKTTKKTGTYNFTKEQLHAVIYNTIGDDLKKAKEEARQEAITVAMSLLFVLPMQVLMEHYWPKTYKKKIPEFTEYLMDYYEKYENGELDYEKIRQDLWDYAGVKFEVKDVWT